MVPAEDELAIEAVESLREWRWRLKELFVVSDQLPSTARDAGSVAWLWFNVIAVVMVHEAIAREITGDFCLLTARISREVATSVACDGGGHELPEGPPPQQRYTGEHQTPPILHVLRVFSLWGSL